MKTAFALALVVLAGPALAQDWKDMSYSDTRNPSRNAAAIEGIWNRDVPQGQFSQYESYVTAVDGKTVMISSANSLGLCDGGANSSTADDEPARCPVKVTVYGDAGPVSTATGEGCFMASLPGDRMAPPPGTFKHQVAVEGKVVVVRLVKNGVPVEGCATRIPLG